YPSYVGCDLARSINRIRHPLYCPPYTRTELNSTEELAQRIKYDCRTIRQQLKDSVLIEGTHYIKPFGRRKILFLWEAVGKEILKAAHGTISIPMANGGYSHG
ncbi:hypothetical protein ACQKD0_13790, partial [Vreelandella aquamarina]|uniref:hypothetical protein n=3 Tax=Vreelandella aquamarina TaxID=77097 RepID=UPI003CFC4F2D